MPWETVIGIEVHAELSTKSKIFCGCTTAFGGMPNTHICPVCSGMPGALPKLNRSVVEYAIRLGLALGCDITHESKLDRKNYFYPDLPKGYQVSQLYAPICRNGHLEIECSEGIAEICISEIHMEEDAGKLIHDSRNNRTLMDFNRCGVPLLEIVTYPDFRNGEQVVAFLEKLREILLYLDICDCKMQEGSMRTDINLSVREHGGQMGTRTEMKNLNSFKAIGRAVEFESARQIAILENGGQVEQETRRWDDDAGESYGMRLKENAQDYRYFPEPDLLPLFIDENWVSMIKKSIPELAHEKRKRYISDYGISEVEVSVLTTHKNVSDLFEKVSEQSGYPLAAAHLITGEIMRLLGRSNTPPEELSVDAGKLSQLVKLVSTGEINRSVYKETVDAVMTDNIDPLEYIAKNGLMMQSDNNIISEAVRVVIKNNQRAVSEYKSGKDKALGFLMGQAMKQLGGSANPDMIKNTLLNELDEGSCGFG